MNCYEKDNHGQIIEIGGCDRRTKEVAKAIKDFNTPPVVVKPKPKPSPNSYVAPKLVNSGSSSGSSSPEKKKCCKCCCCR